jgi:hypothetical protein
MLPNTDQNRRLRHSEKANWPDEILSFTCLGRRGSAVQIRRAPTNSFSSTRRQVSRLEKTRPRLQFQSWDASCSAQFEEHSEQPSLAQVPLNDSLESAEY